MVEKVIWTRKSLADLRVIYDYINKDSSFYANLTAQQIIKKTEQIIVSPLAGRIVPEFNDPALQLTL